MIALKENLRDGNIERRVLIKGWLKMSYNWWNDPHAKKEHAEIR